MSEIQPFSNGEFSLFVTPHDIDGFRVSAPELARALGFRDAYRLLESIPEAEKGYTTACTPGGEQRVSYLTEAGFYRALGQRQAARITDEMVRRLVERFQTWVYRDVLPALRRGEIAPVQRDIASLTEHEQLLAFAAHALEREKLIAAVTEERDVVTAALESATPAIAYHDRFVIDSDVATVKTWGAQFGLTEPQARKLLMEKNVIYRQSIGMRWSGKAGRPVEEFEYRARAGRVTFDWFDLRPQHSAPRHHNGQVRQTLYIRQQYALQLGGKLGLSQQGLPGLDRESA